MPTPTTLPGSFTAGDVLTAANMNDLRGAFRILQVAQAVKTDTQSTNSNTMVDITGLSVTITPLSNTSKFLLVAMVNVGGNDRAGLQFTGGNSTAFVGDTAGNRVRVATQAGMGTSSMLSVPMIYLDSPATSSAITYKVQFRRTSINDVYINRAQDDTDVNTVMRGASSLIVCEVSA